MRVSSAVLRGVNLVCWPTNHNRNMLLTGVTSGSSHEAVQWRSVANTIPIDSWSGIGEVAEQPQTFIDWVDLPSPNQHPSTPPDLAVPIPPLSISLREEGGRPEEDKQWRPVQTLHSLPCTLALILTRFTWHSYSNSLWKPKRCPLASLYLRSAEFLADPVPLGAVLCSPGVRGKLRPERKRARTISFYLAVGPNLHLCLILHHEFLDPNNLWENSHPEQWNALAILRLPNNRQDGKIIAAGRSASSSSSESEAGRSVALVSSHKRQTPGGGTQIL